MKGNSALFTPLRIGVEGSAPRGGAEEVRRSTYFNGQPIENIGGFGGGVVPLPFYRSLKEYIRRSGRA
jgi:hypothetical protein